MDNYFSPNCDHLGRGVCRIIKRLLGGAIKITDRQQMVTCLEYIGAVKDNRSHVVVPAWWQIILTFTLFGRFSLKKRFLRKECKEQSIVCISALMIINKIVLVVH